MGHVGRLTYDMLSRHVEVVVHDVVDGKPYPWSAFQSCDFLVVCVQTPPLDDGAVDVSYVEAAFAGMPSGIPVVLRSTVPPGTSDRLASQFAREVMFWPEYVGETRFASSSWAKFTDVDPFQVFGAKRSEVTAAWIDMLAEALGPLVRMCRVEPAEAELVKYMENSWFAVKVTFVNEFRRLAESQGLEWRAVREAWLLDPRIERDHSDAFASSPGFGGRCLPKDVAGLLNFASSQVVELPLMSAVDRINRLALEGSPTV